MPTLREFVTFDADFPDDSVWDDEENLVVPGGRAVADAVRVQFETRGLVTSSVVQHSFYGWAFEVKANRAKTRLLLQAGDSWLMAISPVRSLVSWLSGNTGVSAFCEMQRALHAILTTDTRFSRVLWHARDDYESGRRQLGTPSP